MATKSAKAAVIELPEFRLERLPLHIIGTAPLIVHAFSEKARKEMLGKQMKLPKGGKDARDPYAEVNASLYKLPDGRNGMPSVAFKNAAVTACTSLSDVTKVAARQAFRIEGESMCSPGIIDGSFVRTALVPLVAGDPAIREDVARLSGIGRNSEMRYRPEFWPWGVILEVIFNPQIVSSGQLISMFSAAGHGVGVGDYRPERDGESGTFVVVDKDTFDTWRKENGI